MIAANIAEADALARTQGRAGRAGQLMVASAEAVTLAAAGGERRRRLRLSHAGLWLALGAIIAGLVAPIERYLTPQHGLGYGLGILGGSLMLLMLVYPVRKRMPSLAVLGTVPFWFRLHMVLGVVGPLAILYHSNFSLGATNSNVALACMLIVASSGLVGRYLYARIHHGLYGRRATLRELAGDAENLRQHSGVLRVLPGLVAEIERAEGRIAAAGVAPGAAIHRRPCASAGSRGASGASRGTRSAWPRRGRRPCRPSASASPTRRAATSSRG